MLNWILLLSVISFSYGAEFNDAVRQEILNYHNSHRASVQPSATNMMKMAYSMELEALAVKWAGKCVFEHPKPTDREYVGTGQNIAIFGGRQPNFTQHALNNWWNEVSGYDITNHRCSIRACGHYTAMAWATTTEVGCAWKLCPDLRPQWTKPVYIHVCQYKPAGNFRGTRPYKVGRSCSECPSGTSCENNLCVSSGSQKPTVKPTTTTTTTTRKPTTTTTSPPVPPPPGTADQILQPSTSEKARIIQVIDTYRKAVSPTASNMLKVSYADHLSTYSMYIVRNCKFEKPTGLGSVRLDSLGVVFSKLTTSHFAFERVLSEWWRRGLQYNFDSNTCQMSDPKYCRTYLQLAWHNVKEMGCAAARCGTTYHVACLFNGLADFNARPYTKGPSASACPIGYVAVNKLCYQQM